MIEMKVSFDEDRERALQDIRHWAALALTAEEKMSVNDPVEMERLADAVPAERAASRWIVSSDAEKHVERIRSYVELGFNHLVFHAPGPSQSRCFEALRRKGAAASAGALRLTRTGMVGRLELRAGPSAPCAGGWRRGRPVGERL